MDRSRVAVVRITEVHSDGTIILTGLAGAASWVCYFFALRDGPAGPVQAIDRLSLVFTLLLAAAFLSERLTGRVLLGGVLTDLAYQALDPRTRAG